MIRKLAITLSLILGIFYISVAQLSEKLSKKVILSVNTNIETYFFAEKLAVEHIGNYVFSNKDINYTHQPIVYYGLKQFMIWKESPVILRISEILKQLRDTQYDNQPQLIFLLYRNQFPKTGYRWAIPEEFLSSAKQTYPGSTKLFYELTDSLMSFYKQANVQEFVDKNLFFYKGALAEAKKYINVKRIPYMEKWYGQKFDEYQIFLMQGMPISPGEDNFRAFGPTLKNGKRNIATMVFSTSVELPFLSSLNDYKKFGFDNKDVVTLLTTHEFGHSFVNPYIENITSEIATDTALFTTSLRKSLEDSYISSWKEYITEHIVRLGEIRIAKLMGDITEETRLREYHTKLGFILIPLLERKIAEYETNRLQFPIFASYLPNLYQTIRKLTPSDIDTLVEKK